MEVFGLDFAIGNTLGYFSFIGLIILFILYFMQPKPFKKIIPSLIFLESGKRYMKMSAFFRRFVKDWLMLLQLLVILLLCLATLKLSTEMYFKKINKEVTLVIDASASSQAGNMFGEYKKIARKYVGVRNSIILIKDIPEVVAKQTNAVNAYRLLSAIKPTESLSNVWDGMMIAADISESGAQVIVLSDFVDKNNKDLTIAKKILEAKGLNVELINPKEKDFSNIGIINYVVSGNDAVLDIKNFDDVIREVEVRNLDENIRINPYSVEQISVEIKDGYNEIKLRTWDDFEIDDTVNIIIPKISEDDVLYITNQDKSFIRSAFESIKSLKLNIVEPPIVPIKTQKIIVMDNVDYNTLLPGTVDDIKKQVSKGSSLIITSQKDFKDVFGDLLPVEVVQQTDQAVNVVNSVTIDQLKDFNFGLSSEYYLTRLKKNNSIVIAEANDKETSPLIVLAKYGQGNVLYYGILDEYNAFKLSPQYPLFWVRMVELLTSKNTVSEVNLKIGDIIYGETITGPDGKKYNEYTIAEKTGIYKTNNYDVSVNLVNVVESDINKKTESTERLDIKTSNERLKQAVELLPLLLILAGIMSYLEIYFMKKRGDI